MTETRNITCDGCGKDITRTSNCDDYRINLKDEHIPSRGGFVTAMAMYPLLGGINAHFCSTKCLYSWIINSSWFKHYSEKSNDEDH